MFIIRPTFNINIYFEDNDGNGFGNGNFGNGGGGNFNGGGFNNFGGKISHFISITKHFIIYI